MNIRSAILCDDIRQEDNNKQILIGVYGDSVNAPVKPAPFSGWILVTLDVTESGTTLDIEKCIGTVVEVQRAVIPPGHRTANFRIAINNLFYEETPISIRVKEEGADWSIKISWIFQFTADAQPLPDVERERYATMLGAVRFENISQ